MLIPGPSSLVLEADNVAMVSYLPLNTTQDVMLQCALIANRCACFRVTHPPDKTIESHQTTSSILIYLFIYLFIFVIAIAFVAALLSSRRATAKFLLVSRTLRSLRCVSRRLAAITRSPSAETQNITRIRLLLLEQMPRVGRLVSHCFGTIL